MINEQEISFTAQTAETNRHPKMFNEELSNLNLALNPEQLKIFIQLQYWTRKKSKL